MRVTTVVGLCLVSFGSTIAVLLYDPDAAFVILALAALCIVGVPFFRIDLTPWLVTPPLTALTLWSFSAPGAYLVAIAGAALCAVLYGVVLLVRLTALRSRKPLTNSTRRVWVGSVMVGVIAAVVAATTIPLELRFRVSEDAMTRTAREVLAGERDPATIERIGLWNVWRAERLPGGMIFLVEGAGLFDSHGFLYPTDGLPPPGARYYGGGWYLVTEDFEL